MFYSLPNTCLTINFCLQSLQDGNFPFLQGKFTSTQTLDDYEKAWHTCVYEPSKTNLKFMVFDLSL